MKTKEQQLLESATALASTCETWADLSNALFDPDGLLAKAFATRSDRLEFMKTNEYESIRRLIDEAEDRTGLLAGASPKQKNGKYIIQLPRSLQSALEKEAAHEGVSLGQLVVTKLAIQLADLTSGARQQSMT